MPSFFGSWLTAELAIHHVFWQAIATLVLDQASVRSTPGRAGLGLVFTFGSWFGLLVALFSRRQPRSHDVCEHALSDIEHRSGDHCAVPRQTGRVAVFQEAPRRRRSPATSLYRRIAGQRSSSSTSSRPPKPGAKRPAIMQIHGGSWVMGDKREQGWPLLSHLAANGWVCFNAQLPPQSGRNVSRSPRRSEGGPRMDSRARR